MTGTLYVENTVASHPRVLAIRKRFPAADVIPCNSYTEIFNRKAQNFRLQKLRPSLILAGKFRHFVLPTPDNYGIGGTYNYYFSHMLNCLYDCRYCFLQGMYQSAHYVLFVNYEDYAEEIISIADKHHGESTHFFSGYDCDSLAMEPVTGFAEHILPVFAGREHILLELRTKSTQIRSLLRRDPLDNCVIAWSLSPDRIARAVEHKAPTVDNRIQAMRQLQEHGWQIGLRFDPLIYHSGFETDYAGLFTRVFSNLDVEKIHSVSLGSFRLPKSYFRKLSSLYTQELLFASPLEDHEGVIGYKSGIKAEIMQFCRDQILTHVPQEKYFPCEEF